MTPKPTRKTTPGFRAFVSHLARFLAARRFQKAPTGHSPERKPLPFSVIPRTDKTVPQETWAGHGASVVSRPCRTPNRRRIGFSDKRDRTPSFVRMRSTIRRARAAIRHRTSEKSRIATKAARDERTSEHHAYAHQYGTERHRQSPGRNVLRLIADRKSDISSDAGSQCRRDQETSDIGLHREPVTRVQRHESTKHARPAGI